MDQRAIAPKTEAEDPMHGGRLIAARRLFPGAPEPFIDLSTGINPFPYPIPPLEPAAWTRLPEPEEIAALQRAAASVYRAAQPALVVAVPGTQMLVSLLPRLFPYSRVAILSPTYGEYGRSFAAAGAEVHEVTSLDKLKDAPCAVLCNPNNPDGRRYGPEELRRLLDGRREGLMILDESFADLEDPGLSLVPNLPRPGLLILRSVSKTYGLGGLRLGFALASPELAAAIRASLGPWPVSGPAIEIGRQALEDQLWLAQTKERLTRDAAPLDRLLGKAGPSLVGGTLLFRLFESPDAQAHYRRLGQAGILVRRFSEHPRWLRFGIPGNEEEWRRLAEALA
jgi:cobalamin biosynthetic protein CobC